MYGFNTYGRLQYGEIESYHAYVSSFTETVTLSDSYVHAGTRAFEEIATISDTFASLFTKLLELALDTITITDTTLRAIASNAFSDTVTPSDTFISTATLSRAYTETFSLEDLGISKAITRITDDETTISDTYGRGITRTFIETEIGVTDSKSYASARAFTETGITISDSYSRNISTTKLEEVLVSDTYLRNATRSLSDITTLTDTFSRTLGRFRTYSDTYTLIAETFVRNMTKTFVEVITPKEIVYNLHNGIRNLWTKFIKPSGVWTKQERKS